MSGLVLNLAPPCGGFADSVLSVSGWCFLSKKSPAAVYFNFKSIAQYSSSALMLTPPPHTPTLAPGRKKMTLKKSLMWLLIVFLSFVDLGATSISSFDQQIRTPHRSFNEHILTLKRIHGFKAPVRSSYLVVKQAEMNARFILWAGKTISRKGDSSCEAVSDV